LGYLAPRSILAKPLDCPLEPLYPSFVQLIGLCRPVLAQSQCSAIRSLDEASSVVVDRRGM